ncbi:hypothetical protein [Dactylosporangium sp. CA-139066]|uniref:hypothetical protein n=1 Tax=Dactylosporangium sp. CA-139066 TaxID=3239930 RepID=UPI003D9339E9
MLSQQIRGRLGAATAARAAALVVLAGAALVAGAGATAYAVTEVSSSVRGTDGRTYTATNHLTPAALRGGPREWLLAWAGAANANDPAAQDFIAVIDATKGSKSYGQVVNTVTVSPQEQNEPHHLQYIWHKGQHIFAAGMFSDSSFVFDSKALPALKITGINLAADTPCGSAPDAFWSLRDGTAYATYLGGPDVSGPCTYTNGETRVGNGANGSPGEVVRVGADGRTLSEIPMALPGGEDPAKCHNTPSITPATCANPHGLQVREDLNLMVVSDFAEIKNFLDSSTVQTDPFLLRNTVRIMDITDRNNPKMRSVSYLDAGPRVDQLPAFDENRMVMENAVTNQHQHKGAFASTMAGGAVYYTPDITSTAPQWHEVFDDTAAYRKFDPSGVLSGSNDGGSWLQVTPDDRFLIHGVMGSDPRVPRKSNSGMVFVLDIQKLIAAGNDPKCRIDTVEEVAAGGREPDCPALTGVVPIADSVSPGVGVGPHWGTEDLFTKDHRGFYTEARHIERIATSDYFVAKTGIDGDHRVCMLNLSPAGALSLDQSFQDEQTHQPCVSFNRQTWPHGTVGGARPHGVLFVVSDAVLH